MIVGEQRSSPAVDFYVEKEGEVAFTNLVQSLIDHDFEHEPVNKLDLSSIRAITEHGEFRGGPVLARLEDLSEIPSTCLAGKLDQFFDGKLTPIVQTTRGCPFLCTFCMEANTYYSRKHRKPSEMLREEIEFIGQRM